jgi:hypothetical protein
MLMRAFAAALTFTVAIFIAGCANSTGSPSTQRTTFGSGRFPAGMAPKAKSDSPRTQP